MKIKQIMICLTTLALLALMITPGQACELKTKLYAGRDHTIVGEVIVDVVGGNLNVTYATTGGWYMTETNLVVADSLDDIPTTKKGNPKIGHFPYATVHDPPVTVYTYLIPYSGGKVYIAAHAVVDCEGGGDAETAWGQGPTSSEFSGNSWALYFYFPPP